MSEEYTAKLLAGVMTAEQLQIEVYKLFDTQKKEFDKIVGKPPNLSRVKKRHWEKWEKEREELLVLFLFAMALSSIDDDLERLDEAGVSWTEQDFRDNLLAVSTGRAAGVSRFMTQSSQRMLKRAKKKQQQEESVDSDAGSPVPGSPDAGSPVPGSPDAGSPVPGSPDAGSVSPPPGGDDVSPSAKGPLSWFDRLLEMLFGKRRADRVVKTEGTTSTTLGREAVRKTAEDAGQESTLVWMMGPCLDHCEFCPMMHRTAQQYWSRFVPGGPAVHPHCCCTVVVYFESVDALIARGVVRVSHIPDSIVIEAGRKVGLRI